MAMQAERTSELPDGVLGLICDTVQEPVASISTKHSITCGTCTPCPDVAVMHSKAACDTTASCVQCMGQHNKYFTRNKYFIWLMNG